MKNKFRRRLLLVLIVIIFGMLFIKSEWISKLIYPIKYTEYIVQHAETYNIEPHLIAAIIRVESNYITGRESSKGAMGLMQLMPTTAKWIIERAKFKEISNEELLHKPDKNIELGSWYIHHLGNQFDQSLIIMIAAYNAGPGNVNSWLEEGIWDGTLQEVDDIPFGETRNYVQKVIYYYNKYKDLYPDL